MITVAAIDIVEQFYALLWPMLRMSALMLFAPVFSLPALTTRLRVLLALALSVMVYPMFDWPRIDPLSARGLLEIVNQITIGLMMGLILQVAIAAVVVAGQAISNSMGLSMAMMIDPNLGNVPTVAQFLIVLATLVFVGLGGHGLLLAMLVESFSSLPVGTFVMVDQSWRQVLAWSSMMFLGAVLIALPVMVTLLFINIGIGVITRAAPSLNIFAVGLPATIVMGFLVLIMSMANIGARLQWLWTQSLVQTRTLVGLS
ncbi:MAG: Flagellar biosynthetic protein FliR [Pseudomonadota bacterium]